MKDDRDSCAARVRMQPRSEGGAGKGTWVLKGAGRRMNCSTLTPGWKDSTSTAADTHGSCTPPQRRSRHRETLANNHHVCALLRMLQLLHATNDYMHRAHKLFAVFMQSASQGNCWPILPREMDTKARKPRRVADIVKMPSREGAHRGAGHNDGERSNFQLQLQIVSCRHVLPQEGHAG